MSTPPAPPPESTRVRNAVMPALVFPALVVTFVACIIISNIAATKGVVLFPALDFDAGPLTVDGLVTDGAFWLFPLSYVIGDIISEVYGFRAMRRVVAIGFVASIAAAAAFRKSLLLSVSFLLCLPEKPAANQGVPGIFLAFTYY